MRSLFTLAILFLILAGCSHSSLRDEQELENLPLREASKSEAARLKLCLRAVAHLQKKYFEEHGHYIERARDLGTKGYCKDIKVQLETEGTTFQATAFLRDDDYAVKWVINQNNVMEEETDPAMDDDSLEF